jgi:hypothetical protein
VAETILFPDAEDVIAEYLAAELTALGRGVPVGTRPPDPRPTTGFLVVRRTGGTRYTLVTDAPLVAVEAWAGQESVAYSLAQLVRGLLAAAPGRAPATVYRVREASGPANLPDPVSPLARYTATYEIHIRGAAA